MDTGINMKGEDTEKTLSFKLEYPPAFPVRLGSLLELILFLAAGLALQAAVVRGQDAV